MAPGGKAFIIFNFPPGVLQSAGTVPDRGATIYSSNFNSFAGRLRARARLCPQAAVVQAAT
jgi:hypothetical protein